MKLSRKKTIWVVLISGFFLFSLMGCSTMKDLLGRANLWNSDKKDANLTDKDVAQFMSKVRSNRGNPDSHYLLGCYYQERGRHKEAIEELNKVLFIDPYYVKAYNGMGVSYDLLGDFPRAIESYKNALKLNPDLDYVQNNLGYSYLLQGKQKEAIIAFKKAVALNDKDKRFHNNLGLAYAEEGQFDLALAEFKRVGDDAKAYYNIAQVYYKKGLYNEAMAHYSGALALDPLLTCARTALEAASVLSRVFHSDTRTAKAEDLVTPEKPSAKTIEELTTAEARAEKPIAQDKLPDNSGSAGRLEETNPITTVFPLAAKEVEPRELVALKSVSVAHDTFELQVASFRSKNLADSVADSLQGSGYRTTVKDWKDEKGEEWYRLVVGSFVTKDEALTRKVKIEEEYKVLPIIIQSKAVKTHTEELVIQNQKNQRTEKSRLNSLRDVEIEISNGNGVRRMARRVGDYLKRKGCKVVRLTNADNFNYSGTRIYYHKGYDGEAGYVAEQLPVLQGKEEIKKLDRPNIKMKVLIGKDLVPKNKIFAGEGG